ncbi:MAG: ABC transporter permease [SAR324 cluster bacterium]|nr:ABC transporter permease [SAR324 cluster bacterium]
MNRASSDKTSLLFVDTALACIVFADLEINTQNPWRELGRMALGAVTPNFLDFGVLVESLLQTVAFALVGVSLGGLLGFGLALLYHLALVRVFCAAVRSVHELFWALLLLQFLGLNPITGLLAIALPYGGIFAKVYSEILEEADPAPLGALPGGSGHVSAFFFARLPDVWAHIISYTSYRLECGLRSSAVLGFVGLPTLGFHLESYFRQGQYSQVSALLILFYLLIATLRWWARPRLLPFYLLGALALFWGSVDISMENVVRFFSEDIVPAPLRNAEGLGAENLAALGGWSWSLLMGQALPAVVATLLLTQIALVGTGMITLVVFPLVSRKFFSRPARAVGHGILVVMRSTPEYILAYIFLQIWGPSMLPAIVALAIHNGAIIGHLTGRHADQLPSRPDAPRGLNLYGYDILPRVYGQFMAFLFYRWEVIMRETAILGMLGIHTLGFYVDSAIQDIRLDRALLLIFVTALLNVGVDALSRTIRARLRLSRTPDVT